MKLLFLEKFEEKVYFKTSHLFWHLLLGISGLCMAVGLLILLWGLTPSIKPFVKKQKYPKAVEVTVEEVELKINPPSKTEQKSSKKTDLRKPDKEKKISKEEEKYLAMIDSFKVLLPSKKYSWKTKRHWERGYFQNKWVVDVLGINDRFKYVFKKVNADDYELKGKLLESYISIVSLFPDKQRLTVLKSVIEFSKTDVQTSLDNVSLLKGVIPNFSTDDAGFIKTLAQFGRKNPRDGRAFIKYFNKIITKFSPELRESILSIMVKTYYQHYNRIEKQIESTDLFVKKILDKIEKEDQAKALIEYYKVYNKKNYSREQKIRSIDSKYKDDLYRAERKLSDKKSNKANLRIRGLQAIGASIVFIAFFALFLVLLSIQRNIKAIKESNNK